MDVSTHIPLPNLPLQPWLRLAHIAAASHQHTAQRAALRSILDFEIVLQLEHSNWIYSQAENGSLDIAPGEVAFIPPDYPHAWGTQSGTHLAVHFDLYAQPDLGPFEHIRLLGGTVARRPIANQPQFCLHPADNAQESLAIPFVTAVRNPAVWQARLQPLVELYQRRAHHSLQGRLLAAETILWAVNTLVEDSRQTPELTANEHKLMAYLARWETTVQQQQTATPTISVLARQLNVSETGLRELFHRVAGRSPRLYFEERRIERAARALLETDSSIANVARAAGYDDPYHFSRVFKRVTGKSPREYRRHARDLMSFGLARSMSK
jgi:AraC-like DNA-binding protein